jgi:hypothetical protein
MSKNFESRNELLKAVMKRKLTGSDSYRLIMEHKNQSSESWCYENLVALSESIVGYPKLEIF